MKKNDFDKLVDSLKQAGRIKRGEQAGGFKKTKITVGEALQELAKRRDQAEILELFGTVVFDEDYDHKRGRTRAFGSPGE
jgi:hypothetical protein